jgi:hypothetical protein
MDRKEVAAEWDDLTLTSRQNLLRNIIEQRFFDKDIWVDQKYDDLPPEVQIKIAVKLGEFE